MPQMSPYNWLILFFMFNLILNIIISNNYFMNNKKIPLNNLNLNLSLKNFNWKW